LDQEIEILFENQMILDKNTYNFNPLYKLIEAYDENKKLYERLLQVKGES